MRTVRPRLDTSALNNELCERDVPEIDREKLAMDNSSMYDIHTGLKLDEAQVRAGRETEVKQRMLEFEVYEEVNEERARGKKIWNTASLDSQKRPGPVRSRLWFWRLLDLNPPLLPGKTVDFGTDFSLSFFFFLFFFFFFCCAPVPQG